MVCMQVLTAMEVKFKNGKYSMMQVRGVLTFDTESVPVQQFQARCADHILQAARHPVGKAGSQSPGLTPYHEYAAQERRHALCCRAML